MEGIAALILLSQNLALGSHYPWAFFPYQGGRILWVFLSLAFLGLVGQVLRGESNRSGRLVLSVLSKRWALAGLVLLNIPYQLFNFIHFREMGYPFPWPQILVCFLGAFWVRRDRLWISSGICLALLACSIWIFPLDPRRSDMLPVIARGLTSWREGISPYLPVELASGPSLMWYLPGTFFSHLPAWVLSLDLRWNQFLYRSIWLAILVSAGQKLPPKSDWRGVFHLFVLSPFFNFRHELYFEVFLLLIVLYWRFARGRAWALAVMVVTRQWAWVLAPFCLLGSLGRRGFYRFALALAVVLGAMIGLLYRTTTLPLFFNSAFAFQSKLTQGHFDGDYGLTLAPLFYAIGATRLLQPIQGCLVLGLLIWAARSARAASVALIGFVLFNMHFWNYFWLSPALWLLAQGIAEEKASERFV